MAVVNSSLIDSTKIYGKLVRQLNSYIHLPNVSLRYLAMLRADAVERYHTRSQVLAQPRSSGDEDEDEPARVPTLQSWTKPLRPFQPILQSY
jgi:hypothetical protein